LVALVFLAYIFCPPFTTYDSYWNVPTALSILERGSTAVDEYVAAAPEGARYSVEYVPWSGHWYNFYPIGVPVLALPLVALVKGGTAVTALLVPRGRFLPAHPVLAAFLAGDLVAGHNLVELFCAAVFGAITAWLQYRIASLFLSRRAALLLALLFAFGTSEWSIATRSLTQHGPTVLLLSLALYLLLIARERPGLIAYAALPLAFSFAVRPSNLIPVLLVTLYVAVHYRAHLLRFLLWSLPVAVPFLGYNVMTRHRLFTGYYDARVGMHDPLLAGFGMNLFSPSRGLLIFTPIVLFSVAGMVVAWRGRWRFPLTPWLIAIVAAHSILIALYWPGHCYGPRYFTDITYLFIFFLIPVVLKGVQAHLAMWRMLFLLLAAWGIFVHARGATSHAANQWSLLPQNVDTAQWRVWDWSDPQFLRGLR